jgi:hypothetical protein
MIQDVLEVVIGCLIGQLDGYLALTHLGHGSLPLSYAFCQRDLV